MSMVVAALVRPGMGVHMLTAGRCVIVLMQYASHAGGKHVAHQHKTAYSTLVTKHGNRLIATLMQITETAAACQRNRGNLTKIKHRPAHALSRRSQAESASQAQNRWTTGRNTGRCRIVGPSRPGEFPSARLCFTVRRLRPKFLHAKERLLGIARRTRAHGWPVQRESNSI